jgi:hypothetical protein
MRRAVRWFAVLGVIALASPLVAQGPGVHRGALSPGDQTLRSGEYCDNYTFEGRAGQRVIVDLRSSAFDPYVMVIAPSGSKKENDDYQGSNSHSRLELVLEESGSYRVVATSYRKDEVGAYELSIDVPAGGTGISLATTGTASADRLETGRLAAGDETLRTGEYMDSYEFTGRRGQRVTVDLRAQGFDPYLIIKDPADKQHENDDYEGDSRRSLVTLELPADGRYRVMVTSYRKGETGSYDLRISLNGGADLAAARAAAGPRIERGDLAPGDDTLRSGELMDAFEFEGRPGERVTLDVASQDFDTYLILVPPRGQRRENDDVEGRPRHSVIEADLTEAGRYRVVVTTYQKGERGRYELRIDVGSSGQAPGTTAAAGTTSRSRDVSVLGYGESSGGRLTAEDPRLESGEYRDAYAFEGAAGDAIVIELESRAFDPYLILIPPQGEQIDNDDAPGRPNASRIELTLRASGRYRILATSYQAGKTGDYELALRRATAAVAGRPAPGGAAASGTGRVFGVFVGISNYGGRASNLPYTADDARRAHQAMARGVGMREGDATILVDQQATVANIRRAFDNIARQAGPTDMFVFFYSGHGGRVPRQGFQAADPDGRDETLALYDGDVIDDDFSGWLTPIRARSLIVLDACFSGGFSKDIISMPGRMGLFSSEEDVTSGVAAKFRAGGYLAQFIFDGVGDRLADADGDRAITALELSQYLHERYRADVKSSSGAEDFVRTGGPQSGYQHLVVDRGSIGPYDVLFR